MATATVSRGTIAVHEEDPGTIGYAASFTVYSATAGTVTWLPATGAVIRPGRRLFAVDGQDTVLMRGATPAWRAFGPGMTDGADVAELQRNLVALGYDPYHAITPGDHYDWATQAAVERWQAAHGWWQDGQVPLGQLAFLPGPVRVAGQAAGPGATVAAGTPLLTATSTTAVVTVALPADERSAVTAGAAGHGHAAGRLPVGWPRARPRPAAPSGGGGSGRGRGERVEPAPRGTGRGTGPARPRSASW